MTLYEAEVLCFNEDISLRKKRSIFKKEIEWHHQNDATKQSFLHSLEFILEHSKEEEIKELMKKEISFVKTQNVCMICHNHTFETYKNYSDRQMCLDCQEKLKEKEKKTWGWFVYHFLGLKKACGKFAFKSDNPTSKYGLQRISVDRVLNEITLEFYFGRSFIHRPLIKIPLPFIERNEDVLRALITTANHKRYLDITLIDNHVDKISTGLYRGQEGYRFIK